MTQSDADAEARRQDQIAKLNRHKANEFITAIPDETLLENDILI